MSYDSRSWCVLAIHRPLFGYVNVFIQELNNVLSELHSESQLFVADDINIDICCAHKNHATDYLSTLHNFAWTAQLTVRRVNSYVPEI